MWANMGGRDLTENKGRSVELIHDPAVLSTSLFLHHWLCSVFSQNSTIMQIGGTLSFASSVVGRFQKSSHPWYLSCQHISMSHLWLPHSLRLHKQGETSDYIMSSVTVHLKFRNHWRWCYQAGSHSVSLGWAFLTSWCWCAGSWTTLVRVCIIGPHHLHTEIYINLLLTCFSFIL